MLQIGTISLADRIRGNIKSDAAKDQILARVEGRYGIRILQRHHLPVEARTMPSVVGPKASPHWACLRSNGNPYLMLFTLLEGTEAVLLVDLKIQQNHAKPRVLVLHGRYDPMLFERDTLVQGEMVRDREGRWLFLINDLLVWQGRRLAHEDLPRRLRRAAELLERYHDPDPCLDVCIFHIKRFVLPTQEGIKDLVALSKELPYTSRGIYFWPHHLDQRPKLFNFDDSLISRVVKPVKDVAEFRELGAADEEPAAAPAPAPVAVPTAVPTAAPAKGEKVLWLRKTESPDVYDLFTNQHPSEKTYVGVAHVPGLQASKALRAVFRTLTIAQSVAYVCRFEEGFQKWVPVAPTGAPVAG